MHSSVIQAPRVAAAPLPAFLDGALRLVLLGGKGGVGKTTAAVATALALAARRPDERVLLVSTDPAHSIRHALAGDRVPDNLDIDEIDAPAALAAFRGEYGHLLHAIARRGTFLDDDHIRRFLSLSLPGLDEVIAFLAVARAVGAGRHAAIVVDTAPTGHTLRLLEMPAILRAWLGALDAMLGKHRYMRQLFAGRYERDEVDAFLLDMAAQIEQLERVLADRERTRFVPVTLAEPLAVSETERLIERLDALGVPVAEVVFNQVVDPTAGTGRDARSGAGAHRARAALVRGFAARFPALALWTVPLAADEARGADRLRGFWDAARAVSRAGDEPGGKLALVAPTVRDADTPLVANPAPPLGRDVELVVFGGKGGVGKTTLACATALALARGEGADARRVLLLSADPAHSIADCLGGRGDARAGDLGGDRPVRVAPGLHAIEVDGTREFQALIRTYRRELAGVFAGGGGHLDLAFDREVMERLFDLAPPGVDEIAALTRVIEHLERGEFECVVVDAAPTGHLLRLLEMPAVINQWLVTIFSVLRGYRELLSLPAFTDRLIALSRGLKRLRARLADADRAVLCAVTRPTEVTAAETRELLAACARIGVHAPVLFVNQVAPPPVAYSGVGGEARADSPAAALEARERRVIDALAASLPAIHHTIVYRQPALSGVDALCAAGARLFAKGARR